MSSILFYRTRNEQHTTLLNKEWAAYYFTEQGMISVLFYWTRNEQHTISLSNIRCMNITNQDGGLFERNHSHLLFPSVLRCIPVGLELSFSEATLVGAHIQVPESFLRRNYWPGLCWSKRRWEWLDPGTETLSNYSHMHTSSTCNLLHQAHPHYYDYTGLLTADNRGWQKFYHLK